MQASKCNHHKQVFKKKAVVLDPFILKRALVHSKYYRGGCLVARGACGLVWSLTRSARLAARGARLPTHSARLASLSARGTRLSIRWWCSSVHPFVLAWCSSVRSWYLLVGLFVPGRRLWLIGDCALCFIPCGYIGGWISAWCTCTNCLATFSCP